MFIDCSFAQDCWNLIGIHTIAAQPLHVIEALQDQLSMPFSLDIIIIMAWSIWIVRNDLIFKNIPVQLSSVLSRFKTEFALVILRAKPQGQTSMNLWRQTLL